MHRIQAIDAIRAAAGLGAQIKYYSIPEVRKTPAACCTTTDKYMYTGAQITRLLKANRRGARGSRCRTKISSFIPDLTSSDRPVGLWTFSDLTGRVGEPCATATRSPSSVRSADVRDHSGKRCGQDLLMAHRYINYISLTTFASTSRANGNPSCQVQKKTAVRRICGTALETEIANAVKN